MDARSGQLLVTGMSRCWADFSCVSLLPSTVYQLFQVCHNACRRHLLTPQLIFDLRILPQCMSAVVTYKPHIILPREHYRNWEGNAILGTVFTACRFACKITRRRDTYLAWRWIGLSLSLYKELQGSLSCNIVPLA
jgi:hypothetical protein